VKTTSHFHQRRTTISDVRTGLPFLASPGDAEKMNIERRVK
jgi:hypothetical protein